MKLIPLGLITSQLLTLHVAGAATPPPSPAFARPELSKASKDHGHANLRDLLSLAAPVAHAPSARTAGPALAAGRIWWTLDSALTSPAATEAMRSALARGIPVVVIRSDRGAAADEQLASLFGVHSDAALLAYIAPPGGVPVALALDEIPEDHGNAAQTLARFADLIAQHAAAGAEVATAHSARSFTTTPASLHTAIDASADDVAMLPRLRFTTVSMNSANGGYLSVDAELVRDVRPQGSRLLLLAKSTQIIKPRDHGVQPNGAIVVPHTYHSGHQVMAVDGTGWRRPVSLVDWFPRDDGRTELEFSETRETSTSFGLSLSPEVGRSIADQTGAASSGKLQGAFNFERSNTLTRSIQYSVKDYSVNSNLKKLSRFHYNAPRRGSAPDFPVQTLEWGHQLASRIDSDKHYFRSNGPNSAHSNTKLTPSMRGVTLELLSIWELPELGNRGSFEMTAGAIVHYLLNPRHRNAPQSRLYLTHQQDPQAYATWRVTAGSPFLMRFPTVRLSSRQGAGGCIIDAGFAGLIMGNCPYVTPAELGRTGPSNDQWTFDSLGRYVNRDTQRCMAVITTPGTTFGDVSAQPCSSSTAQRWAWSADRLVSLYDARRHGWRLNVKANRRLSVLPPGGADTAVTDNPNNALLNPWSSYPAQPRTGDSVPNVSGVQRNIPDYFLTMAAIQPGERWEPIVLRQAAGE